MSNKKTIKALEELVKTEYMAVAALDAALEEADDNKVRKQYKKWRDSHVKQADALNGRLGELGGETIPYEVGTGKGQATLWGKLTGLKDETSVAGMRLGAERGIKRYIDHLDDIEDAKSLGIVRKNLEMKQDEIEWYDEQGAKEREQILDTKLETGKEKVKLAEAEEKDGKKGGLPFPLLVAAGAAVGAAYFLMRKGEESDYEDYGEDAFRYEEEGSTPGAADVSGESFSTYNAGNMDNAPLS